MLIEEAKWFANKIANFDPSVIFPMLDIGSSTQEFREKGQPWIDSYLFKPIRERQYKVVHMDAKQAPGVDVVGDFADRRVLQDLLRMNFRSVLCANVLEHVSDRGQICRQLVSLIPSDGHIFVSCPYSYPYHADPIDTMFRPNPKELARLFPGTTIIHGEVVTCGTRFDYLGRPSLLTLFWMVFRLSLPFRYYPMNVRQWFSDIGLLPWLFRHFQATCLVLRKATDSDSSAKTQQHVMTSS